MNCPRCSTPATAGEKFCGSCGAELRSEGELARERLERADIQKKTGSARKWLLAVSILTFLTGFLFYFGQRSAVERQIRAAEQQMAGLEPEERDRRLMASIGMTWEQAVRQDRGKVSLLLWVNITLSGIYFGLWIWARRNAFAACLIALILFVSVVVVSGILDPTSLLQGWLVKIFFTAALIKAISSAIQERKVYGTRP